MSRTASFALFCCAAAVFLFAPASAPAIAPENKKIACVLYTAQTTTTPQIPLWAALNVEAPGKLDISVEYWKNLDDLRGIILAGKGDIWVGHIEGFAQAALRGAPITLAAVTGWKKFYFVAPPESTATDAESLAAELREGKRQLAVAPQGSPALAVLETMRKRGGPSFAVSAMPAPHLMLEMLRGSQDCALLPEPLVSSLAAKKPGLRIVAGLEDEFSRLYGGPARLPWAGVAVNTRFAAEHPEIVGRLVRDMARCAARLAGDPSAAIDVLPEEVKKNTGTDIIRASLARDMIFAAPAAEVKEEIAAFLRMALPDRGAADASRISALLEGDFLFREKRR
ncbi:MAG: hypothetical protein LBQ51_02395 [Desulfovibrio sp.]|jgi:NitT/TauT family transport system substrate-binding protein|nr:hypothetical protein [Desulfovibrio sp.]